MRVRPRQASSTARALGPPSTSATSPVTPAATPTAAPGTAPLAALFGRRRAGAGRPRAGSRPPRATVLVALPLAAARPPRLLLRSIFYLLRDRSIHQRLDLIHAKLTIVDRVGIYS